MASKKPKTISLSFRVPIEEREALEKSAIEAGTTLAGYVYATLVAARSGNTTIVAAPSTPPAEPPPRVPGISLSDPAAVSELKRIGININQIAHAANAGRPSSQRTMVEAFAGLFGLLSEPESFIRSLAEVKPTLDAARDAPAEPTPDQRRLVAISRDLEMREAELRNLAEQLDTMRQRESVMRDQIARLETSLAKAQAPAPRPPLPLPTSKPPVVPPSPPKPAASPPPRSVPSAPATAIPVQPSRFPAPPNPTEPRRRRSLKMHSSSEAPRHDPPNPQARFELQEGRGVHPPRPAKGDERPSRLGFLRKLWGD